eukprot:scaffold25099_cov651-Cylindrotheca_fusiformis.AAC.1
MESQQLGFGNVFHDCITPTSDNGEVFLSTYLKDQVARNKKQHQERGGAYDVSHSNRCSCEDCIR